MQTIAILKTPGYTRVSFADSDKLITNELKLQKLSQIVENIKHENICGVTYVLFDVNKNINENDIILLSRLSFTYAIFELIEKKLLKPLLLNPEYFINPELSGILKYSGKTNELFTRLMLNLAILHLKNAPTTPLNILDPLAGKGTTLFEALMQGHHAYGVEIEPSPPQESVTYLKKYLETARYKHSTHTEKVSGTSPHGKFTSTRYQLEITKDKEGQKDPKHFEIIQGDTRNISHFYKKNQFSIIIADLPYGVHHGSKAGNKQLKKPQGGITRNALGLIKEAMPEWVRSLKPGGVMVLAWNLFLISREEVEELLYSHGLKVPENASTLNFSHRVDQAIDRDIIICIK